MDYKEMWYYVASKILCSHFTCDKCYEYFNTDKCPNTRNNFTVEQLIEFVKNVTEAVRSINDNLGIVTEEDIINLLSGL